MRGVTFPNGLMHPFFSHLIIRTIILTKSCIMFYSRSFQPLSCVFNLHFFYSGYAAEWGGIDSDGADHLNRIWSHKWGFRNVWRSSVGNIHVARYHINPSLWHRSGSTRTRIGVIAHEQGKS